MSQRRTQQQAGETTPAFLSHSLCDHLPLVRPLPRLD
jgi:hypothetical protein